MSDGREFHILDPESDEEFLNSWMFGFVTYDKHSDVDLAVHLDISVVNVNKSFK